MPKRPLSITIISWIFIAFGIVSFLTGLLPLADSAPAHPLEFGLIAVIRILAVVCGVFMLYGFNWARWLLVGWVGYHVILSIVHSPLELVVHSMLFAGVLYFIFRPQASAYFRGTKG